MAGRGRGTRRLAGPGGAGRQSSLLHVVKPACGEPIGAGGLPRSQTADGDGEVRILAFGNGQRILVLRVRDGPNSSILRAGSVAPNS
jgi:hypothetical protein